MGKRALFCAGLALSLLLSACGGGETQAEPQPTETPEPPAAAEFALPYYAGASLHPITGESRTNLTLNGLVYEGLFELDNHFEAHKKLVRDWSVSEDGLRYTFTLTAARFSDGSPLTAAEAAASLELARISSGYAARLRDVVSVEAEGSTLTVTLRRPNPDLPALLDIPVVKEQGEGEPPLGTGRYAYAREGEELCLRLQAAPREGLPKTIPLKAIQSADDLIYAFDTNEIGLVTADLTGSDTLGFSGGYEGWDYPTTAMVYLGFRTGGGFCADPALRQAISRMVDRDSIVAALYARHAEPVALPAHPASQFYDDTLAGSLTYSPQEAAALLEGAGYQRREDTLFRQGRAVKLELLVDADNSFRGSVADYLAGELGKLGITVTVTRLSWSDYTARLRAGNFDLYLAECLMTADFDPEALVGTGGSLNFGGWRDSRTDEGLAALHSGDGTARRALYDRLAEQAPMVPICFKNHTALTQWGQVQDLTPTRADPFAGDGWRLAEE